MDLLAHLHAFVAVAEARSFTRGAETCGAPQPVVSRRIAALEKHLGGTLLHRTSRQVDLTELGRTLLPHAADLLARTDHLYELARSTMAAGLVVGVPPGTDPRTLVAARRAAAAAGLAVTFSEHDAADRASLLRMGRLDIAVLPCPTDEEEIGAELGAGTATDDLRGRRVHLDQLRRTASEHGRPRALHLDAEDDVPWVRDPLRRAARAAGLRDDQVRADTTPTQAMTNALEHGDAVLCTQARADALGLHWRPLGDVVLRRTYSVASGSPVDSATVRSAFPALALAAGLSATSAVADPTRQEAL
ncbi:LysR family transcriptional regulator [Haloactinopolyspora alba]|uniref:LysR family transcriptional regulator n=1 Tax=Haloactinopolyspora alba TaxID=648780 RepID=UPI0013EAE6BC|nr:LysR family transcriptional regulator [Haloactinopolyspora alba]